MGALFGAGTKSPCSASVDIFSAKGARSTLPQAVIAPKHKARAREKDFRRQVRCNFIINPVGLKIGKIGSRGTGQEALWMPTQKELFRAHFEFRYCS